MNIREAIYSRLTSDATVAELVGTRVYPHLAQPGTKTYPMVVYRDGVAVKMGGRLMRAELSVACITRDDLDGLDALRAAVVAVLHGTETRDTWGGGSEGIDVKGCFLQGETTDEIYPPESPELRYYISDQMYILWWWE